MFTLFPFFGQRCAILLESDVPPRLCDTWDTHYFYVSVSDIILSYTRFPLAKEYARELPLPVGGTSRFWAHWTPTEPKHNQRYRIPAPILLPRSCTRNTKQAEYPFSSELPCPWRRHHLIEHHHGARKHSHWLSITAAVILVDVASAALVSNLPMVTAIPAQAPLKTEHPTSGATTATRSPYSKVRLEWSNSAGGGHATFVDVCSMRWPRLASMFVSCNTKWKISNATFVIFASQENQTSRSTSWHYTSTSVRIDVTTAGRCSTLLMGCADTSTTAILASVPTRVTCAGSYFWLL